jgi:hypothetical protein
MHVPQVWSEPDSSEQFRWVFHLALRNLMQEKLHPKRSVRPYEVFDLLRRERLSDDLGLPRPLNEAEVVKRQDIAAANQEGRVLYILDGFDEVVETLHAHHLFDVVRELMQEDYVLLTSRPYNLQGLRADYNFTADEWLEVTGFTDSDIRSFAVDFFEAEPARGTAFLEFLDNNLTVRGSCRVPISCELFCSAWDEPPFQRPVTSMTELYEQVVLSLCSRALEKQGIEITHHRGLSLVHVDRTY